MNSLKPTATIKGWTLHFDGKGWRLIGEILNHPKQRQFIPGTNQWTSRLLFLDFQKGIAETENTIYRLEDQGVY